MQAELNSLRGTFSQPLTDRQISKAWKWLDRAVRSPNRPRKVPAEFRNLEDRDWTLLVHLLELAMREALESPLH